MSFFALGLKVDHGETITFNKRLGGWKDLQKAINSLIDLGKGIVLDEHREVEAVVTPYKVGYQRGHVLKFAFSAVSHGRRVYIYRRF